MLLDDCSKRLNNLSDVSAEVNEDKGGIEKDVKLNNFKTTLHH